MSDTGSLRLAPSAAAYAAERAAVAQKQIAGTRIALLAFGTVAYLLVLDRRDTIPWLAYLTLALGWIYAPCLYFLAPRARGATSLYTTWTSDIAFLMVWVLATGGVKSEFYVVIYGAVIGVAFQHGYRPAVMAAAIYAAAYVVLLAALGQLAAHLAAVFVRVGCVFLIAPIGGLLAREAFRQGTEKLELGAAVAAARAAEEKLRESESRLSEAQRIAQLGSWEWNPATDGATWSDELWRIYGLSPQPSAPTLEAFLELVHPDDRGTVEAAVRGALEQRRDYAFEHRIVRADGSVRTLHSRGRVIADDGGRIVRLAGTAQDVTARKEVEAALRAQISLYEALLGAQSDLGEGVSIVDAVSQRFLYVNDALCAIYGYARRELLALPSFFDLVPAHEAVALRGRLGRRLLGEAVPDHYEMTVRHRSGRPIEIEVAVKAIQADGGNHLISIIRDVTERKKAERELEVTRKQLAVAEKLSALGTLVSGVAHEIRTPSTYITSNLFLLRRRLEEAAHEGKPVSDVLPAVERYGEAAAEGMARIDRLVHQLRRFVRGESQERAPTDLREVVETSVELFRATQRGRTEVELRLAPAPPIVLNSGQIQQVLLILLNNAAEAMPTGGRIVVAVRPRGGGGEIIVDDEGSGVSPETESRLFELFFTTKPEGTGLGLSIARRIVDAHGGEIRYQRLENGARFSLSLPARGDPAVPA